MVPSLVTWFPGLLHGTRNSRPPPSLRWPPPLGSGAGAWLRGSVGTARRTRSVRTQLALLCDSQLCAPLPVLCSEASHWPLEISRRTFTPKKWTNATSQRSTLPPTPVGKQPHITELTYRDQDMMLKHLLLSPRATRASADPKLSGRGTDALWSPAGRGAEDPAWPQALCVAWQVKLPPLASVSPDHLLFQVRQLRPGVNGPGRLALCQPEHEEFFVAR